MWTRSLLSPEPLTRALRRGLVAVALCLGAALPARAAPLPPLTDLVMDGGNLLSPGQGVRVRQRLLALKQARGVQFVVATVPSLEGEAIEQRALALAEHWRLGRRGTDDGLLLLVAAAERQVRFEVGYGLEGDLPDAAAARLIDEARGRFADGPGGEAIVALVDEASGLLERRLPPPAVRRAMAQPLVDATLGLVLAGTLVGGLLAWLTLGRRRLDARPFRPLRPHTRRPPEWAGTYRDSLWYAILFGWLLGGRGGRGGGSGGGGSGGSGGPGAPRGGGGSFGGGGASGRW